MCKNLHFQWSHSQLHQEYTTDALFIALGKCNWQTKLWNIVPVHTVPWFYLGTSFLGGKMVRWRCALGRVPGLSPLESVSVPLSEHIYSSVSTGRQELSQCHYFKLQLGKFLGGKLECLEEKLPPHPTPSRLNLEYIIIWFMNNTGQHSSSAITRCRSIQDWSGNDTLTQYEKVLSWYTLYWTAKTQWYV